MPKKEREATMTTPRRLQCAATLTMVVTLAACAPAQSGTDQCKDSNINLIALKDERYRTLPTGQGGLSASVRNQIDDAVHEFMRRPSSSEADVPGCAIAVTRNQQIAYLNAYGVAELGEPARPFTIATPSAIGSISKTLTALGALTLVEDGKLNLGGSVFSQMSAVQPAPWQSATLLETLAHRGGFKQGGPDWDSTRFDSRATMEAYFNGPFPSLYPRLVFEGYRTQSSNQPFSPNTGPLYSNVGYSIAGAVVDWRSHGDDIPPARRGYEPYIWHAVGRGSSASEPTMISACLATDFRVDDIKDLARGYATNGNLWDFSNGGAVGWGWEGPAGGWTMTIGDLARLMLILQSNAVVPKAVVDDVMRQSYGYDGGLHIGLGLELEPDTTPDWFGKGGDILGYTADMKIWPSSLTNPGDSWGVAFACNRAGTGKGLTEEIHDVLDGGGVGGVGFGGEGGAAPQEPTGRARAALVERIEPLVRAVAAAHLRGGDDTHAAWVEARRALATLRNGPAVIAALERGDFAAALRLVPTLAPAGRRP
jgi:CubicO group peptidase (beta-lactamase class C family)